MVSPISNSINTKPSVTESNFIARLQQDSAALFNKIKAVVYAFFLTLFLSKPAAVSAKKVVKIETPAQMPTVSKMCTVVKQGDTYQIIPNAPINDFFAAPEEMQKQLLNTLWDTQKKLESESPAAGYQVHIDGDRQGKAPFSMKLIAVGERAKGSEMELNRDSVPAHVDEACRCVFCNLKATGKDQTALTKMTEKYNCFVINSLRGKPLIIPKTHAEHWFDAPAEKMHLDLMYATGKVQEVIQQNSGNSKYSIWLHIGSQAAQSVPHLHVHVGEG